MTYKEALEIIQQYHYGNAVDSSKYMSAMDLVEFALEKQIAKKPIDNHHCPSCETGLPHKGITDDWCRCCFDPDYCPECGQRLDWSDLN